MDIFTKLDEKSDYSMPTLQLIIVAWVMGTLFERKTKVSSANGHVLEEDYRKQSIYSLLYALYRSMGVIESETGKKYELTFNTWGYAWPESWGEPPTGDSDPQRFGKNAYTGLFQFDQVKDYVRERDGKVHVVEMGCGTGAGADHICENVLPSCTYEAVDMQLAAIKTCRRLFVPRHRGRLVGTHADATRLSIEDGVADFIAVCETHVTDQGGIVQDEDQRFFETAYRILKPGGFLVWGNVIPDDTWEPCFGFLESMGMKQLEVRDVTKEAITARHEDAGRVQAFLDQTFDRLIGFRIPILGAKKRAEADLALKNFYRDPGTNLYNDMATLADTYKVVLFQKPAG